MDDDILAVASQQTLLHFITEDENFCLDEASFTTPLSELVEMALYSSSAACFSGQQRSIAFDAGLTCGRSLSEQQGQLTAPDAAMHSVRHLVHTRALHVNSERTLEHSAHFSFFKIGRLFALAKVGLAHAIKLVKRQSSEDELLVVY
eukprot:Em0016g476a